MVIDFNAFDNKFLSLEVGTKKAVVLSRWRTEEKTFNEQKPRLHLVFNVLKVDDEEHADGQLEYSTSSAALVMQFKPFILLAEKSNKIAFVGVLERVDHKTYTFTAVPKPLIASPSLEDLY